MVQPQEVTHVIYHAHCDDGFGAAWSAWKRLGDAAAYLPANHGDPPPELPAEAVLAMVDFSYPRPLIDQLASHLKGMVILDHHVTAQSDLSGLEFAVFDMERSGAHLSWNFFHADQPLPELLAYIEDKDLWRFRLPQSKEVTAALRSYPMDFQLWDSLTVENLKAEGISLLRHELQVVKAHCSRMRWESLAGYRVPVVNATDYRSEIANCLCCMHKDAPFAAAYFDTAEGFRSWSLRSVGEFSVADVAKKYGGGGHRNAAGFIERRPVPKPPE